MAMSEVATSVTIIQAGINKGFQAVSLTNFTTSAESVVASGSAIEIAGATFSAASDTTPQASTWTAISTGSTAYITLTPSGTAGSQVVTAKYSSTDPTWRDDLQGWYESAASSIRYIGSVYKSGTTSYEGALIVRANSQSGIVNEKIVNIGEWNMDATATVTIDHGLGGAYVRIRSVSAIIRDDAGSLYYPIGKGASAADTTPQGYVANIQAAGVALVRLTGGEFDHTDYNATASTVANRGWVTIVWAP